MTTFQFDTEQLAFLESRLWAALATGRRDGSPQISHVGYVWDGSRLLVSVKSYTAKWKNTLRQPRVALPVHGDRKQLVIYGVAECISQHPERAARCESSSSGLPSAPAWLQRQAMRRRDPRSGDRPRSP